MICRFLACDILYEDMEELRQICGEVKPGNVEFKGPMTSASR